MLLGLGIRVSTPLQNEETPHPMGVRNVSFSAPQILGKKIPITTTVIVKDIIHVVH